MRNSVVVEFGTEQLEIGGLGEWRLGIRRLGNWGSGRRGNVPNIPISQSPVPNSLVPQLPRREIGPGFMVTVFKKVTEDTTQKTTQKILGLIAINSHITRQELADSLAITSDGIKFHLTNLKKKGLLKRVGPDKGGHWEIIK